MPVNLSSMSILPKPFFTNCINVDVGNYIFMAYSATSLLVLFPLLIITLYIVLRRWWQQHPSPSSRSDYIILNMAAIEILCLCASVSYCVAHWTRVHNIITVTAHLCLIFLCGQITFHLLACLDRYLAVVHPVIYMHPKKHTVRQISILSSWLFNLGHTCFINYEDLHIMTIFYFVMQALCLCASSFCSIAVLQVLRRPGVGGEVKERVDQMKQRAFKTILSIMITLLIKFCGNLILISIYTSDVFSINIRCALVNVCFWLGLPSSLVLPLLFLHRERKLPSFWTRRGKQ